MQPRKLKGKLKRLNARGLNPGASAPESPGALAEPAMGGTREARFADLRERMGQLRRGRRRAASPRSAVNLPGTGVEGPFGVLQRVETRLSVGHLHGTGAVKDALNATGEVVSRLALDENLRGFIPETALFVDTETTGLAGGAGTLAFVIGLGFYDAGQFVVEQFVLSEPGAEAPILKWVAMRMEAASALVSFNGKSYDWPLLRTRFVLNRLPVPELPPHLDLLHSARRVFKHQFSQMRLTALEEQVLGYERVGDIPGAEIPARYFEFLQTGEGRLLEDIVVHNRDDIVAMVALLGVLSGLMEGDEVAEEPGIQLALAQLEVRGGDCLRAMAWVERVVGSVASTEWKFEALLLGARMVRRREDYKAAERLLVRAVELDGITDLEAGAAHLMLAKLYEHKLGNLKGALEHARRCVLEESAEDGGRRIARLHRKLDKRC